MSARSASALATLGALLALAGCPPAKPTTTTTTPQASRGDLDAIKARGKLIVATDVGYDPFETLKSDGSYQGYDVDLATEVARDIGVPLELKNVAWDGIIPELLTGKVDAIFSGMSITADRQQAVAFSDPYFQVGQVVVKKKGDGRIRSYRDLDAPGMRVATQGGTTGERAIVDFMPHAQLLKFPKIDEACVNVIQGKCDAVVFDHPFLIKYVTEQTHELEGIWDPFTKEPIASACRKESQGLVQSINATLQRLDKSGKLAELQARWFPAIPGTHTAEVGTPAPPTPTTAPTTTTPTTTAPGG